MNWKVKAKILTDLRFANIPDEPRWFVILEDLRYLYRVSEPFQFKKRDYVPSNFVTDLTSIPRALWSIYPPHGEYTAAAVIHDWYYYHNLVCRKYADRLFLALMKDLGVGWWTRNVFYLAVRAMGKKAWDTDRPKPVI